MKYCSNCGSQIPNGSNFCTSCGQPVNGGSQYDSYQQPVQNNEGSNGYAIAGLICSLFVGSITGLIFSSIGLNKSKSTGQGKGLAIAGIVISVVRLVLLPLILVVYSQLLWPTVKSNVVRNAYCSEAFDCSCPTGSDTCSCYYYDFQNGNKKTAITCPAPERN